MSLLLEWRGAWLYPLYSLDQLSHDTCLNSSQWFGNVVLVTECLFQSFSSRDSFGGASSLAPCLIRLLHASLLPCFDDIVSLIFIHIMYLFTPVFALLFSTVFGFFVFVSAPCGCFLRCTYCWPTWKNLGFSLQVFLKSHPLAPFSSYLRMPLISLHLLLQDFFLITLHPSVWIRLYRI